MKCYTNFITYFIIFIHMWIRTTGLHNCWLVEWKYNENQSSAGLAPSAWRHRKNECNKGTVYVHNANDYLKVTVLPPNKGSET
jgi:hypothetical protein